MNRTFILILSVLFLFSCNSANSNQQERVLDFNKGWKFSLEKHEEAFKTDFDDSRWRQLNLPHDWSVEFPYDTINGEGCVGYLPGGTGWYRKHFTSEFSTNQQVYVLFDGVYNNSEVWINGEKLGFHPYGYTPFYFNLTPYLKPKGQENVLAVKVDRTRFADSRWYTGSGIYRNVKLVTVDKLHVPIWGTFITTPEVSEKSVTIALDLSIKNTYSEAKEVVAITEILDKNGNLVAKSETPKAVEADQTATLQQKFEVKNPMLWNVENPQLYKAVTQLRVGQKIMDTYETTFGIRSLHFDADKGFFLNGQNMKIKGVCLHHDGGLVGAAVPKDVWKRRLQGLKDGGCNAIRISHNPASDEFLELCDEMGFLVQDEFFDDWDYSKDKRLNMKDQHDDYITRGYTEHFQEWAEKDLKTTILAHRNHPSVFQWSIGNEIEWTYPRNRKATGFFNNMDWNGNYFWSPPPYSPEKIKEVYESESALEHNIGETAQKLAKWTKELDTTRVVTANCILPSASFVTGYADALDVVGFSYRRVMYDYAKEHYPNKVVMGTENLGQYHEWKAIMDRDFVSGTFLWTGIDYMGERHQRNPNDTRYKGIACGLLDFAGFKKPSFYMMKSLWNETEPTLYIASNKASDSQYKVDESGKVVEKKTGAWKTALWVWHSVNEHWNYKEGEQVIVEIISNLPEVELFLNGESMGRKKLAAFEDHIYKWAVPFKSGKLEAKGVFRGENVSQTITTAGKATQIKLTVDKTELSADGYEVAHVVAQLQDKDGNPVINEEATIAFSIDGNVKPMGVDNGSDTNFMPYQSEVIKTHKGRCLMIVKVDGIAGKSTISADADGLSSNKISLSVK